MTRPAETLRKIIARAMHDDEGRILDNGLAPFELQPDDYRNGWIRRADAALAAIEASGLVVVPVEPTEEMIAEAANSNTMRLVARAHYKTMLTARPRYLSPTDKSDG